ncbi:MAG: hypothetical protein K2X91_10435, partial [Thermoleophilia bacterium]|nr:hypothetical protein [Thermoleophilia bacterium]
MRPSRFALASALALALATTAHPRQAARAQDAPATFGALKAAYESAQKTWLDAERASRLKAHQDRIEAAKKAAPGVPGKSARIMIPAMPMINATEGPAADYSPKFLAVALKDPKSPEAVEALLLAMQTSGGPTGKAKTYPAVLKAVGGPFAAHPEMGDVARRLGRDPEPEAAAALRSILERNPDPKVQALACRALIGSLKAYAATGDRLAKSDAMQKAMAASRGKAWVDAAVAGTAAALAEADALQGRYEERYAAVLPEVAIGRPMPELVSRDLDGNAVKLSDL